MHEERSCAFRVVLLAALVLFPRFGVAQEDAVDRFLRTEMRRQNIPGLALAVVRNGTVIKSAGYGLADIDQRRAVAPDTVFKIASVSKQFIATGVMLLAQEGRLRTEDPVSLYLREAPPGWAGITIHHLLTHTSGLAREAPGFATGAAQSDAMVLEAGYSLPLLFQPGTRWEYSNLGYYALAETITRVSGRHWADYLATRVFAPLGMTSTRTTPTSAEERIANVATGYVDNDSPRPARRFFALRPSGAFMSTVLDLAKWDAALYSDDLLTADSRRRMWTPVVLNDGSTYPYGYGWMLGTTQGRSVLHHPGSLLGFRANVARFVDARLTVIVLMNLDDVDIDAVVGGLAAIYPTN